MTILRRTFRPLLVTALLALVWDRAGAENLVTVRSEPLPTLPGRPGTACLVASGRPVAIQGNLLWQLSPDQKEWAQVSWHPAEKILGAIAHGPQPYLLLGTSNGPEITRVVAYPDAATPAGKNLPALPLPLIEARGAVLGGTLYLAGIAQDGTAQWLKIDTSSSRPEWVAMPAWAPSATGITSVVAQDASLLVTTSAPDGSRDLLWRWTPTDGWRGRGSLPGTVAAGAARAIGQAHILFLIRLAAPATGSQLVTYHTITNSFATQGPAVTATARSGTACGNGLLWEEAGPAGEARFHLSEIVGSKLLLRPLDWVVIFVYLVGIAGIGVYCYRKERKNSTADFFVGSRTIPFWAAGISLYASNSSSIGYIATTAKAFATNWQYLMNNIIGALALVFVAIYIVPLLRRLELMSVFNYLEQRFHTSVRLSASAFCIMMHLGGRMSVILFLPSLAISTITGIHVIWSILIMGLVTIGYTALGGMRAVIWTDVVQVIVKVGGLIFVLVFIVLKLHGGVPEFIATAEADSKMHLVDWHFDLTKATVWTILILATLETVLTFPKDQVLMQRVFTTKSEKEAGRSVWVFAVMVIPGSMLFYLIGTGLYVFYHNHPERMNPLLPVDATFPLFIAAELPTGITGLMIAGLFSAAMATLSSILNSVATMVSVDFYEKLTKKPDPAFSVRLAEWVTVLAGLLGIGLAIMLSRYSISSFLDVALEFAGLFGGAFGGAYTLGMFTRRANWQGVLIGMIVSFISTFLAWSVKLVHPFLYLAFSILVSIVVGYLASFLFPPPPEQSLKGLTILRPRPQD